MGILNVTPDSFSDGGRYYDMETAVGRGIALLEEGADIIDVGGESTRPGSQSVDENEEIRRTIPVIEKLKKETEATISIDTVKPGVAKAAVDVGAEIVNDVSMLRNGVGLAEVAAKAGASLVLMHSRKTPLDMQKDIVYKDVVRDVNNELLSAAAMAHEAGVPKDNIWLDPGIGFAKTAAHSIDVLARLPETVALGYRVLVGPSRKSFIGSVAGGEATDRIGGTAAAVAACILAGVHCVRVHDVAVMRQAALVAAEIRDTLSSRTELADA